jgi:cytochrome c oxidase cbb3-type subunit III
MRRRAILPVAALALAACDVGAGRHPSEHAALESPPSGQITVPYVQTSAFQAGPTVRRPVMPNPFAGAVHEGRQYYMAFNCAGCHGGRGGGGIGPPFLVPELIYGSDPANIFQSIVQGRPYGMPAYGGKAPDEVFWKIAAYVQSLAEPYLAGPDDEARGGGSTEGDDDVPDGGA